MHSICALGDGERCGDGRSGECISSRSSIELTRHSLVRNGEHGHVGRTRACVHHNSASETALLMTSEMCISSIPCISSSNRSPGSPAERENALALHRFSILRFEFRFVFETCFSGSEIEAILLDLAGSCAGTCYRCCRDDKSTGIKRFLFGALLALICCKSQRNTLDDMQ